MNERDRARGNASALLRVYRICADTTLGVVYTDLRFGKNVRRVLQHRDARRAVAIEHGLPEHEVTEIISVRWMNSPQGEVEVVCS